MSMQGTWCDALTVEAVAESLNIQIYIVESHVNFGQVTFIQPHHSSQQQRRKIYIGHVNEVHYVSTVPNSSCSGNEHYNNMYYTSNNLTKQTVLSEQVHNSSRKRKHNSDLKNIRIGTESSENNEKQSSASKQNKTIEQKKKWNSYMSNYRCTRRATKKNQVYECDNERQSSTTKPNKKSECQKPKSEKVQSIAALISRFHNIVSQGPLYICSCCDQLWYKHSVFPAAKIRNSNPAAEKYLLNSKSVNNKEWLCRTCHNHLAKDKVPPLALLNGMKFPKKPEFFDLNELECRLIAPRLAFQKLMQAPRGRQLKIHGNVVNVPAEVSDTVNMLPRLPNDTGTIKVNLKRKLQYKSSALSLNIRPHKVVQAANWLINNSSLYRQEGITVYCKLFIR